MSEHPITIEASAIGIEFHFLAMLNQRVSFLNLELGALAGRAIDGQDEATNGLMFNTRTPWYRQVFARPLGAEFEWDDDFVAAASVYHGSIAGTTETATTHVLITSLTETAPLLGLQDRIGSLVVFGSPEVTLINLQTAGAREEFLTGSVAAFGKRYGGAIIANNSSRLLRMQIQRTAQK